MSSTKHMRKAYYFILGLLISICMPFFSLTSYANTEYYDIISREKQVRLEWGEQMGLEHLIVYENLFLDIIVVGTEGPLQGYLQISITYENSENNRQTTLSFNLEQLNFFKDLNGDQCQTWIAWLEESGYTLENIDDLIFSIIPMGSVDWIKNHPETERNYGVSNFQFIGFSEVNTEIGTFLKWEVRESLIYALKCNDIIYWDINFTVDFNLIFYFTIENNIAYLTYEIELENSSTDEAFPYMPKNLATNLALEWHSEVSVMKGLTNAPVFWSLNDLLYEGVTVANVSTGKIIDDGATIGILNFDSNYTENTEPNDQIYTSAIPLQSLSRTQNDPKPAQLQFSNTIYNYTGEDTSFSSQFQFYFSSSTLNIIFIVLFNVSLSFILLKKGFKFRRRGMP
ncbi:MAG: hypothetical protein ACTSYB_08570 [Candidatus Helarchaeota archaeon]